MKRPPLPLSFAALTILGLGAIMIDAVASPGQDGDGPVFLKNVREIRLVEVIKADEDGFVSPQDEPGLILTFGVKLPGGVKLITVAEPKEIQAKDSAGRDLAKRPKPRFGELEYVHVGMSFGDEPLDDFTLRLAVSDRSAATFDLKTRLEASVYRNTESVSFKLSKEWANLDKTWFGGREVKARFGESWMGAGIEFSPASAQNMVENIEIQADGQWTENSGWASGPQTITFMFDAKVQPGAPVKLTVRKGFETIPLDIDLKKQPLP